MGPGPFQAARGMPEPNVHHRRVPSVPHSVDANRLPSVPEIRPHTMHFAAGVTTPDVISYQTPADMLQAYHKMPVAVPAPRERSLHHPQPQAYAASFPNTSGINWGPPQPTAGQAPQPPPRRRTSSNALSADKSSASRTFVTKSDAADIKENLSRHSGDTVDKVIKFTWLKHATISRQSCECYSLTAIGDAERKNYMKCFT